MCKTSKKPQEVRNDEIILVSATHTKSLLERKYIFDRYVSCAWQRQGIVILLPNDSWWWHVYVSFHGSVSSGTRTKEHWREREDVNDCQWNGGSDSFKSTALRPQIRRQEEPANLTPEKKRRIVMALQTMQLIQLSLASGRLSQSHAGSCFLSFPWWANDHVVGVEWDSSHSTVDSSHADH